MKVQNCPNSYILVANTLFSTWLDCKGLYLRCRHLSICSLSVVMSAALLADLVATLTLGKSNNDFGNLQRLCTHHQPRDSNGGELGRMRYQGFKVKKHWHRSRLGFIVYASAQVFLHAHDSKIPCWAVRCEVCQSDVPLF